ncbi:YciI family protein [soil metagenome]
MSEYLLFVHYVEGQEPPPADVIEQMQAGVGAFNEELQAAGKWVFAGGLETPDTSTVVQVKDGAIVTTDGPFAEAKEHIGGFWVIDAADLDEALAWAEKATRACQGPVEVRPFQPVPEEG